MQSQIFKNIMKINGFKSKGNKYLRDDGIEIIFKNTEIIMAFGSGDVLYFENITQLTGSLVLRQIINRLF